MKILIYDSIGLGGVSAAYVKESLDACKKEIATIYINSPGGDVFEGMAMYNAIKNHKGKTIARIEGIAYGTASIVAVACDELWMRKGSYFILSEPYVMDGVKSDMIILNKIRNVLVKIYMKRFKKTKAKIIKMMESETWLSYEDAKAYGIVDLVY